MKISILSPVYNEEKHIESMIISVLGQTYSDFELLFVDDGSSDATVDIIKKFICLDDRVRLISYGKKLGKIKAFNLAFEESDGDYILLLGGDDILPVDSLQIRFDAISYYGINSKVVAYFKLLTFSEMKQFNDIVIPRGKKGNRSGGTFIATRKLSSQIFPVDLNLATEDVWITQLAQIMADTVIDNSEITLKYRIHQNNSNPRHQKFVTANIALHQRLLTYQRILDKFHGKIPVKDQTKFQILAEAEELRFRGSTLKLFFHPQLHLRERIFYVFHSNSSLFWLRNRFFSFFSGR